jgi:predicted enzyme related to lactoylglutathione lyase
MPKAFPRGRICWNELMTTDPKAAMAFYKPLVGWGTEEWEGDSSYVMWTAGGTPVGGLMALPDEARQMGTPPTWVMYVAVPDVDASLRQAVGLGARAYVQPKDIPTMGRFAVLGDPQGATFALFSSTTGVPGHDGPPKPGEFSWHELTATDWQAAWDFYEELFGWEKMDAMDMGAMGMYQTFGRAGEMIGGMFNKPPEMPGPPSWLCYAMVPSADKSAETVPRLGGKVLNGPMDVPGGSRITQCMDPQGAAFAVQSNAPEVEAASKPKRSAEKAAKKLAKNPATKEAKAAKKIEKAAKKAAKKAVKATKKAAKKAKKALKKAAKKARKAAKKARRKTAPPGR